MSIFSYANKSVAEALAGLEVDAKTGLSEKESAERLVKYGPNEISGHSVLWWHILSRQFRSPFIYLLIAAAILSVILGQHEDFIMIILFIVINVIIGFYQEFRSEQTLRLLQKYAISLVKVRRAGKEKTVPSHDLVPGDLIMLVTGDMVPADLRILEAINLTVDESILTGESVAVNKNNQVARAEIKEIYEAANLGFSGTTIVRGQALGLVLATGKNTEIGRISHLASATRHVSSFEKGISRFSTFIIRLVLATLFFIFIANLFLKGSEANFVSLLIFSIALAVSVIPEALPLVITFSLSRGALRLAKMKVVVRRLSAIEDLGAIDVLCTDKTGTLTENRLTLGEAYARDKSETLRYAALVSSRVETDTAQMEPFDAALLKALTAADRALIGKYERLSEMPFDPVRRRNSVLLKSSDNYILVLRGAPEEILPLCQASTLGSVEAINEFIAKAGERGHRVLAMAVRKLNAYAGEAPESLENSLDFSGVLSFVDPIKPSTVEAVTKARELGVGIKIITGDSREVAGAVAFKVGLLKSRSDVLTGREFEALSAEAQTAAVEKYSVFARVAPEQKYKIIELLEREHEVGFLGEGINDTPALKIANVSLVVQSAADVAREVADIVLLQKNLKVIIDGIKEGRRVFANTSKYIKITLASNFGNFYSVAIASLLISFLPMLPIQILLLNLLSDFPMIAIAADAVDKSEVAMPRKYNIKDIIIIATILGVISSVFDFIFFGLFYRISPAVLQTNWFIGSILTELVLIYSLRSRLPFFRAKLPSGILVALSVLAAALTIALPMSDIGQRIFHFTPPTAHHLFLIFSIVGAYFVVTEIVKLLYYKPAGNNT